MGLRRGADIGLENLLLKRYPTPEWVTLIEVRASTGYSRRGADQRYDAVALNCYPSKGFLRAAFEIKRTRGDFMRELEDPGKRKQAETYFHESWFVCLPGVCDVSEVPEGWGLLVPTKKGDKLIRKRAAKQRKPKDMGTGLMMSMLRHQQYRINKYVQAEQQAVTYNLNGKEVTEKYLDDLVHERLATRREALVHAQDKAYEEIQSAIDMKKMLKEPFNHLAKLAQRFSYHYGNNLPTAEDVDELVTKAVSGKLTQARESIERTHRHLGALLDKIDD